MKKWRKGLLALALCALLALGAALPAFSSSGTVYLMAVNERVMNVTAENMPTVMGGVLYVPYTMLSIRDTGINLGISALYSSTRRTVMVSNGQIGVTFDLQTNTAQDLMGNPVSTRAMMRNSMPFLPIDYLCSYFGTITCSRIPSDYGTVIRVTNRAMVLRDAEFVDAAANVLAESLRGYYAPGTSVTAPPVPPTVPPVEAEVLLALRWGEQAEELAGLLEDRGARALFLFTVEELRQQDNAVRRLIAAGHTVGLALIGEDAETCAVQLEEGRRLLGSIARYYALVVSADALDDEGLEVLRQKGCAVWSPGLFGGDYSAGALLVEALDPKTANRVELECGEGSAAFLRSLLVAMDEESWSLRQPTAPLLS